MTRKEKENNLSDLMLKHGLKIFRSRMILSNVYNYEEIIGSIKEVLSKGHIDLQETLAASVAKQVLSNPMVKAVKVKTEKLDVLTDSASFGIEIFVEQHDQN